MRSRVILRKRLDRAATNVAFHEAFPAGKLLTLDRLHSDHHPLLFLTDDFTLPLPREKPKRFLAAWLYRDEFSGIFQNSWQKEPKNIVDSIGNAVSDCHKWSKIVFGDIFYRKNSLIRRISGIQKTPAYGHSAFLESLESEI